MLYVHCSYSYTATVKMYYLLMVQSNKHHIIIHQNIIPDKETLGDDNISTNKSCTNFLYVCSIVITASDNNLTVIINHSTEGVLLNTYTKKKTRCVKKACRAKHVVVLLKKN